MTKFDTSYKQNTMDSDSDVVNGDQIENKSDNDIVISTTCPRCLGEKALKIFGYGSFPCDECKATGTVKLTQSVLDYKRRYFETIRKTERNFNDF